MNEPCFQNGKSSLVIKTEQGEKYRIEMDRRGRLLGSRKGCERRKYWLYKKHFKGTDSHLLIKYKFGLHPKIYKKTDYPL